MKNLLLKSCMAILMMTVFFVNATTETASAATLRKGSRGNEVVWLQRNLIGIGFGDTIDIDDGIYGEKTKAGVIKAQTYFGIPKDGIAGQQTQTHIGNVVADIQNDLRILGYNIRVDKKYGDNTTNSVKSFQQTHGLPVTGIADEATRTAMKAAIQGDTGYTTVVSNVRTYSLNKNGNEKITNNFAIREFACKDGSNTILIDDKLATLLQDIRDHFGKPVIINSAYRTEKHNQEVGGTANSYHLYGKAADIQIKGVSPREIAQYAESLGVKGIGLYGTFVHVDTRTNKYYWNTNGQVATFY